MTAWSVIAEEQVCKQVTRAYFVLTVKTSEITNSQKKKKDAESDALISAAHDHK